MITGNIFNETKNQKRVNGEKVSDDSLMTLCGKQE